MPVHFCTGMSTLPFELGEDSWLFANNAKD